MKHQFHAEGYRAEINEDLKIYRRELEQKYGNSLLSYIWISLELATFEASKKRQQSFEKLY